MRNKKKGERMGVKTMQKYDLIMGKNKKNKEGRK